MKYFSVIILALSLQGCYQLVDQSDIHNAIKKCGTLENINEIQARFDGYEYFSCIKPINND